VGRGASGYRRNFTGVPAKIQFSVRYSQARVLGARSKSSPLSSFNSCVAMKSEPGTDVAELTRIIRAFAD